MCPSQSKAGQARKPPAEYNSTPPTQDNSIEGERRGLVFDLKLANQQLREQEARESSTGHTISAEHGGYLALRTRSFAVQVDLETPPLLESHPRRRLTEPLSTSRPKTRTVSARQEQWNRAQHFNLRVPKHAKGSAMCPASTLHSTGSRGVCPVSFLWWAMKRVSFQLVSLLITVNANSIMGGMQSLRRTWLSLIPSQNMGTVLKNLESHRIRRR